MFPGVIRKISSSSSNIITPFRRIPRTTSLVAQFNLCPKVSQGIPIVTRSTFSTSSSPSSPSTFFSRKGLIYGGLALITFLGAGVFLNVPAKADGYSDDDSIPEDQLPVIKHELCFAPNVPPPITRNYRAKVRVEMSSSVVKGPIHPGLNYEFWTFDGAVPGPFIRAREGDVLDISLMNKDQSGMMHNIDFHAVTGPGGGAQLLTAETDETKRASFKLLAPGLFIYHCAVGPVPVHVANGMYGLMLVEPKEGLPKADKEFYVLQSEFYYYPLEYLKPKGKKYSHGHGGKSNKKKPEVIVVEEEEECVEFNYEDGYNENPTSVVFNGKDGALRDEGTLQVSQGDRVRIFFGNAGPNLVSSFHIIGTIMDKVYREGDLISPPARSIQTTLVPAGGATVVEFTALVPGNYTILDHSLFRIQKGAVGFINVNGDPRSDIYHSTEKPKTCPNCEIHP